MFVLSLVINSLIVVMLIFFAFLALAQSGFKKLNNVLTALFALLVAIWIPANYVSNSTNIGAVSVLDANYVVFSASFGAFLILGWLVVRLSNAQAVQNVLKYATLPLIGTAVIAATPLVVGGIEQQGDVYAVHFGPLVFLYATGLLFLSAIIIAALYHSYKYQKGLAFRQMRVVGIGLVITLPLVIALSFGIPLVTGNFLLTNFGIAPLIILVAALYRAAIKHSLFDIRLAAVRTATYVLTFIVLSVVYYLLALTVSTMFFSGNISPTVSVSPINIALALFLALVFQPIKAFFDKATNRLFYKDNYSVDEFILSLNKALNTTSDLRKLLERLSGIIASTLKTEQVFFLVRTSEDRYITAGTDHHSKVSLGDFDAILPTDSLVFASRLDEKRITLHRMMISHHIELMLVLRKGEEVVAYLCLGEHRTSGYTRRDTRALMTISDELVIAIQNALVVEEIRQLNLTLEQRIDNATKELRASNAQLHHLDEVKDEFISMASHQLRTPLTSIKGYISMLLEGDMGDVTKEQKHVLNEAFISSERMVRLIGDFLNVSRLQTGKFTIEKHPVDLARMVQHEVDALEANAAARGIRFIYKAPKGLPLVDVDENKLQQVVMNFSDNAIYYSPDSSTVKVTLKKEGNFIEFKVIDSGIGVPEAERHHLFEKFYRAPNARKARPDGTGVGLYLAKKVVDAHRGEVIFESTEGKGSTFGFRLPIA